MKFFQLSGLWTTYLTYQINRTATYVYVEIHKMPRGLKYLCRITKTSLYNFDPLKPHFYIVKLGFTGVYIIFLISAQNIDCGYSLEPPRRGGSNEYPQSMFWAEIWKISEFLSENFHFFLVVKFSLYLNRRVFVMEYDLRGQLPLTGALTLTGTRKPTVRCLITRPDYSLWEH